MLSNCCKLHCWKRFLFSHKSTNFVHGQEFPTENMHLYLEFASLKWTFLVTQVVQNPPAMWETRVRSCWEDTSSILA